MRIMNVVAPLEVMESVVVDILKTGAVSIINSQNQIDNNAFTFNLENENNLERAIELNHIAPFERDSMLNVTIEKAKEMEEFFGIKDLKVDYDRIDMGVDYEAFYDEIKYKSKRLKEIREDLKVIDGIEENYDYFKNVNIDLSKLSDLKYFKVRFGILDKEARFRLKKNYGNILAMIFHTATIDEGEVYLAIFPKEVDKEIDRILKSLNWEDVEILGRYKGTAKEILENFESEKEALRKEEKEILEYRDSFLKSNREKVETAITSMLISENIEDVKRFMAKSNKYFYLSGWVSLRDKESIEKILSKYDGLLISFKDPIEQGIKPPTKLRNSNFFKPFELLVNMYGVPSYTEKDPTPLFAITYMLLYGAMFGDFGQGAVFFLGGIFLSKKNKGFGGLLKRLGLSSAIFGLLYGSVFGMEDLIKPILIRPFENINTTLGAAIGVGIVFLIISYALGFINKITNKEYEEAFLGKEGLAGFLVFLSFVNLAASKVLNVNIVPTKLCIAIIGVSLLAMILSKVIMSAITKKKIETEDGYYIGAVFGLLETILSVVSNIISFIRVGAFAINHVGLFIAFKTIGQMIGTTSANVISLIVGNIIIIGLEGLIVFIQSLRLEYYEMFSKYYTGDGYEFVPTTIRLEDK